MRKSHKLFYYCNDFWMKEIPLHKILQMSGVRAKKSLGQHFLVDINIAEKIASALQNENKGTVIEIGPGMGVLTDMLLGKHECFRAIELDTESVAYLKNKHADAEDWVINADFLKYNLSEIEGNISVIGNFPYYISSQIFFKVLEFSYKVDEVVCMIQKEVAERIASPPGKKQYGLLSVLLQAYYEIEYLFTVHEHCFSPAPKVKSAVIRLKRNATQNLNCDKDMFFKVVKMTFNQRRKTIRNSLKAAFPNLGEHELLTKRPEQLNVGQFETLVNWLSNQQ